MRDVDELLYLLFGVDGRVLVRPVHAERARRRRTRQVEKLYRPAKDAREPVHRRHGEECDALRALDAEHLWHLFAENYVQERYDDEGYNRGDEVARADS